jgi:acyl-CoA thioester hydrolase
MTISLHPSDNFIFEMTIEVDANDIDEQRHVNNLTYLKWVQTIAFKHWQSFSTPDQQAQFTWVVLRHEIDYLKPAFLKESILIKTWIGDIHGAKSERYTEISRRADSQVLAKAKTVWCLVSRESMRPRRIDAEMMKAFK